MPFSHAGPPADPISFGVEDSIVSDFNLKDMGTSAAQRWLKAQKPPNYSQQTDDGQSFFDFEPQLNTASPFGAQYPSLPDADLTPGWNSMVQMPSPPNSATTPPPSWPPFQHQRQPPVHNILTDIYPDTRVQYGQHTPPDDDFPSLFSIAEQSQDPVDANDQVFPASQAKRKRSSTSTESKCSPPKRARKYGRSLASSTGKAASSTEDVRRHKFLERNRIAASKCRQKKKEWTQNLEAEARELQKNNKSLRVMMDSLRDEIIFLKSEMIKHTSCGCEEIQTWVNSKAGQRALSPLIKTEHSPINSAPSSRRGSVSSHYQEANSPEQKAADRSTSPEMRDLEGLLVDRLVHDTSSEGIASILQTAI
ncbi:MAG: hypothetical protein Q9207_001094 [Kuettlingeria erythrocarpa]